MSSESFKASISMSDSLSRSWNAVMKNIWIFAGFTILYIIVISFLSRIPVVKSLTGFVSFILPLSIFCAMQVAHKQGVCNFSDFFNWTPKFGKLLVANLVLILVKIVVFIPIIILILTTVGFGILGTYMSGSYGVVRESFGMLSGGLIGLIVLFAIILSFLLLILSFSYLFLIYFKDYNPMQALSTSWAVGKQNAGPIILFVFIAIGVSILGVLALLIGIIVAIPVILGMQYFYLRDIFPDDSAVEEWDIMKPTGVNN